MLDKSEVERLSFLKEKVEKDSATQEEKKELVTFLNNKGRLSENIYTNYNKGVNVSDILNASVTIASILLFAYFVSEILNTSKSK